MVFSVQVKRLRHENPLDALIVRGTKRKRGELDEGSAAKDVVFRLAQTYSTDQSSRHTALAARGAREDHIFALSQAKRVKKNDRSGDDTLAPELASMIAEYMGPSTPTPQDADAETEDYVYDVYFSEQAGPLATNRVGYIDLAADEEELFFTSEDEPGASDDSDSNAEDYYANEYPDDSDMDSLGSASASDIPALDSLHISEDEEGTHSRFGW